MIHFVILEEVFRKSLLSYLKCSTLKFVQLKNFANKKKKKKKKKKKRNEKVPQLGTKITLSVYFRLEF